MKKRDVAVELDRIIDKLAAIEHDRWAHWQDYMHGKGRIQQDGSLVIPADLVKRWQKQMATPYAELSEKERESDRDQVRKYLPLIVETLGRD